MDLIEIDNTLHAHQSLQAALNFPLVMESVRHREPVSHRQQEPATAQEQIAALRARKVGSRTAAQDLFDRMKDGLDARIFHEVLQGIMDIQQNKKSTSEVVQQLQPSIARNHPLLFADFLDYIDPTNEVDRKEFAKEPSKLPTKSTSDGLSPRQFERQALIDRSASVAAGLLSRNFVPPGQPSSLLKYAANSSQYPVEAESPSPDRRSGSENSPGMYGFPEPPLYYSPAPPTFAQSFFDYVNQEQPLPRYPAQTMMLTHGLPMSSIAAVNLRDVQQVRLPSMGIFGPGINPYSPRATSSPQIDPRDTAMHQQPLRLPKTRSSLPKSVGTDAASSYPYPVEPQTTNYQGEVRFLSPERPGPFDYSDFPPYQQDVYFNLPNYTTIQVPRLLPLQRKRGMSNLRSSVEPALKVSKTSTDSRPSQAPNVKDSSECTDTPASEAGPKPYVHHICGRAFAALETVKAHHHNEEMDMGCWVRHGRKAEDKAWDNDTSCKVATSPTTAELSQEPVRPPTKPSVLKPAGTFEDSRRKVARRC